jgi:hypothetical protein
VLASCEATTYAELAAKKRPGSQAVMVGSVTIVIVGGLILVWFLSHPFRDEMGSIKPTAMERTLDEFANDPAFRRESSLPHLCDAEGRPELPAAS